MKTSAIAKIICLVFTFVTLSAFGASNNNSQNNSYVKDSAITAYVKSKMALKKPIANLGVKVITTNGVVSLSGSVDSEEQASSLIEIAESAPGVKDVDARYLVLKKSGQPFTDTAITAKVKGTFLREKLFTSSDVAAMKVRVETRDGVVYLSGTVDNAEQATNAVKLAQAISGVVRVESSILVKEE